MPCVSRGDTHCHTYRVRLWVQVLLLALVTIAMTLELCGMRVKISMSVIRTRSLRGEKIAGLSDLLDKNLSTVIANGGAISAKDIAASRYPTSRRQRASNDVAGAAKYLCLPSAPIWEHCVISAYCFCGSASGSRPFSHRANA